MKKLVLTLFIVMVGISAFAQENALGKTKSFFKSCQYTISVGYGSSVTEEPFDVAKMTLNAGLDIQRDFKSFKDEKFNLYGLTGAHIYFKGGKQDQSVDGWMSSGNDFTVLQISIPIHVGAKYNFKKSYLFIDAGPYVGFNGEPSVSEGYGHAGYELKKCPVEFGVGFNMGICLKKFGLSFGLDKGLSPLTKFDDGEHTKNLTSLAGYFRLQWTFNR